MEAAIDAMSAGRPVDVVKRVASARKKKAVFMRVQGLSEAVRRFVQTVGGEVLPESSEARSADYLFRKENLVVEQKTLEEEALFEHTRKLQPKVNDWTRRGRLLIYGRASLELKKVPAECQQEWLDLLQAPVERIVQKANSQIRSTKTKQQLLAAKGLLLVVNEGNLLYNAPNDYLAMVARVLKKRTREGELLFPDIDAVIYLSIRAVLGGMQPVWQVGFVNMADKELHDFVDSLQQLWLAFLSRGRLVAAHQLGKRTHQ